MRLFSQLKAACQDDWEAYTRHPFVQGMADGTLPESAFQHYLKQDYLFLIQFSRAYALACYKSRRLSDLRRAKAGLDAILDNELSLHVSYCAEWGIDEASLEDLPEATANMAYTRYVMERGMAGDLLDLYVALAPCMLGYGEIGQRLAKDPATKRDGNPYLSWIEMYSGDEYQEVYESTIAYLDDLAGPTVSEARIEDLSRTFTDATRLEIGFWQMGLDEAL